MIYDEIQEAVWKAFPELFGCEGEREKITVSETSKDFTGDVTLVVFPLLKLTKKNPEESARIIGDYLVLNNKHITAYTIIKGFLNLSIDNNYWTDFFIHAYAENYQEKAT